MSELTRILVCSKQQTTQTVDKLIKSQYVERQNDETDRRKIWITLTPAGERIVLNVMESVGEILAEKMKALNQQELNALSVAIDVFNHSFSKIGAQANPGQK